MADTHPASGCQLDSRDDSRDVRKTCPWAGLSPPRRVFHPVAETLYDIRSRNVFSGVSRWSGPPHLLCQPPLSPAWEVPPCPPAPQPPNPQALSPQRIYQPFPETKLKCFAVLSDASN